MKKLLLNTLVVGQLIAAPAFADCIPARTEINLPSGVSRGMYHRVHPSGDYLLISSSYNKGASVQLIDLTKKDKKGKIEAEAIPTPMKDETYPVEGKWRLFASPNHDNQSTMHYYAMDDILKQNTSAQPVHTDRRFNEYYHSSAELPESTPTEMKFRTMLWGGGGLYRDYTAEVDSEGKVKNFKEGEIKTFCGSRLYLTSPILSKDGTEVAFQDSNGTVVYRMNKDNSCTKVEEFGYPTSKVSFSYPKHNENGMIGFHGRTSVMVNGVPQSSSGVHIYHRCDKVKKTSDGKDCVPWTQRVSGPGESTSSYPGITEDGRVIYLNDSNQVVIIDPNQLNPDGTEKSDKSACIQETSDDGDSGDRKKKKKNRVNGK